MGGSVIIRRGTSRQIHAKGDRVSTFSRADELAGHPVDRRKMFAIIDGELFHLVKLPKKVECPSCKGKGCAGCGWRGTRRKLFKRYRKTR